MARQPVAIIGGGFLGIPVARALARPVRVTTRSARPSGLPGADVSFATLDVTRSSVDDMVRALDGCRAVVACYATGGDQDRRALYVDGTRALLDAMDRVAPERFVYVSSTSALPDVDGELDESCAERPSNERGLVQREAEDLVMERCERANIPWVVLRLAGLYGPGRPIGRIYRPRDAAPLPGDGMTATNLIHLEDAVQAVVAAVDLDPAVRALVHVCDDDHRSRRDMMALAAESRGEPPPRWERPPEPGAPVRGKRVANGRLGSVLGIRLLHPQHVLD